MTEKKRFHFDYVCGDTGLIDEQAEHQWFIENCCSITDLKKNWKTVCDKLNEVHEENEELKLQLTVEEMDKEALEEQTAIDIEHYTKQNEKLQDQISMLKTTIARNEAYIHQLTKQGEWRK